MIAPGSAIKSEIISIVAKTGHANAKCIRQNLSLKVYKGTVYKALDSLIEDGVIVKVGNYFQVTLRYYKEINSLNNQMNEKLLSNAKHVQKLAEKMKSNKLVELPPYKSLFDFENEMAETVQYDILTGKHNRNEKEYIICRHYAFLLTKQGRNFLNFAKTNDYQMLVLMYGKYPINQIICALLRDNDQEAYLIDKPENMLDDEICISGDQIMTVNFAAEYKKEDDESLKKCKHKIDTKYSQLLKTRSENKIMVTIEENKEKAECWKQNLTDLIY